MRHDAFLEAYRSGTIRVRVDRVAAGRFLSARLLLPLFMLPVLGAGVGLALIGWVWTGLAIIGVGTFAPLIIKRTAPHFVITQALQDAAFYEEALANGLLEILETSEGPQAG
jgi:hypothetical protein